MAAAANGAGLAVALIGGVAVNAFEDPRFTKDLDLTVAADTEAVARFVAALERGGFEVLKMQAGGAPSGPDFVQLIRPGTPDIIDILTAKTTYQELVIKRAIQSSEQPLPVATAEDLIVLKLIAGRSKDWIDAQALARHNPVDWDYVTHWAEVWEITDRLERLRAGLSE